MARSREELIYGRQPVIEMLKASRRCVSAVLIGNWVKQSATVDTIRLLAGERKLKLKRVDKAEMASLAPLANHQGVAALVSPFHYDSLQEVVAGLRNGKSPALLLILDHIQDPQNLGSLLRSADATGVDAVIIPDRRASGVTPAAVSASAGAAEHMSVVMVTNLTQTMLGLRDEGLWFVGLEALPEATLFTRADLSGPTGLVLGSEGRGLKKHLREHCDFLVKIPLLGQVTSLNAAVAGAVVLYEALRQRGEGAASSERVSV